MVCELKGALKKQTSRTIARKVSRLLFKQHSMPHSETGKAPAELMLGRNLRSALSRLHSDMTEEAGCPPQSPSQSFQRGDSVYVRNFCQAPRSLAACVLRHPGHVMYDVETSEGSVHRRHRDPLRKPWEPAQLPQAGQTSPCFGLTAPSRTNPRSPGPKATEPPAPPSTKLPSVQRATVGSPTPPPPPEALRRSTRHRRPGHCYGIDES